MLLVFVSLQAEEEFIKALAGIVLGAIKLAKDEHSFARSYQVSVSVR